MDDGLLYALAMIKNDIDSGYSEYYIKRTYELTDGEYTDAISLLNQINEVEKI